MKFLLTLISILFWSISMFFFTITIGFSLLIHKLYPDSYEGNCWTHALPRWIQQGGYLAIRPADRQSFLNYFFIPHVIWIKKLPDTTVLEQLVPIKRKYRSLIPYYVFFFKGKVSTVERPHDASN